MRMLVVNEIAKSSFTDPIVIKTQEEAPMEAPVNIHIQPGNDELIVTWQVPNKSTWNGKIILLFVFNWILEKINFRIKVNFWAIQSTTLKKGKTSTISTQTRLSAKQYQCMDGPPRNSSLLDSKSFPSTWCK